MKTSRLILGLMTLGLILSITSGALASTVPNTAPFGAGTNSTGGVFAEYFQNIANFPCTNSQIVVGFKTSPTGDYLKPDCASLENRVTNEFITYLFADSFFSGALYNWLTTYYPAGSNTPGSSQWHDVLTNSIAYTGTNVGIGTNTPSTLAMLEVAGKLRINDGTQGAGKVLTSDANGLATWSGSASVGGGVTGGGQANSIARWITSSSLGIGAISDDGLSNVTIGTLAQPALFRVNGDTVFSGQVRIRGGNPQPGSILISSDLSGLATWSALPSSNGSSQWKDVTGGIAYTGGKVGIGTDSPTSNLHIKDNSNIGAGIRLDSGLGGAIDFVNGTNSSYGRIEYRHNMGTNGSYLRFIVNNTEAIHIDSTGNVGIGTSTTPGAKLEVAGDAIINGITIGRGNQFDYNSIYNKNFAIGKGALISNEQGAFNFAIGEDALHNNTDGSYNTAIGDAALTSNTTGESNTAIGGAALKYNIYGDYNTAIGNTTLINNISGNTNTANGFFALYLNTYGSNNTANGFDTLSNNTTGSNNTALGASAGSSLTSGNNNIFIGSNNVQPNISIIASNQLNIGNWIYGYNGNIGIGAQNPGAKLEVVGNIIAASPTQDNHVATKAYVDAAIATAVAAALAGQGGGCTTIGSPCGGGIYAGDYLGHKIIATPGGCTDSTNPTCDGSTDTLMKLFSTENVFRGTTSTSNGASDTATLAAFGAALYPAASYCANMVYGGQSDWYLPALNELNLLRTNRNLIGGFVTWYRSTTEYNYQYTMSQYFPSDNWQLPYDKTSPSFVRCIRKI